VLHVKQLIRRLLKIDDARHLVEITSFVYNLVMLNRTSLKLPRFVAELSAPRFRRNVLSGQLEFVTC